MSAFAASASQPDKCPGIRRAQSARQVEIETVRVVLRLTGTDTAGACTLLEYTAPPHFSGSPPHWHRQMNETLLVLDGELTLQRGEETTTLIAGDAAFIPPGMVHRFTNLSAAPVRFLSYLMPGGFDNYFVEYAELADHTSGTPPLSDARALAQRYDCYVPPE